MTDSAPHPARRLPRPQPDGLGATGAALWDSIAGVLSLEEHEALKLLQLCRAADLLDELQAEVTRDGVVIDSPQGRKAHPAVVELRQQRVAFARLASDMRLPAGLAAAKKKTATGAAQPSQTQQRRPAVKGVYAISSGSNA